MADAPRWTVFRHGKFLDGDRIEIFVSPTGDWYTRAGQGGRAGAKDELPDLEIPMQTPGVPPLRLKCINHWKPVAEAAEGAETPGSSSA